MLNTKLFPTLLIILDLLAAMGYGCQDVTDWRHIGYWLAAAFLTACVTF